MSRPAVERTTVPSRRTSLALLLIFATLGSLLGIAAAGDNVLSIDVRVLEAIQKLDLPGIDTVVSVSNTVFGTVGALALAAALSAVALVLGRRLFALQMAIVIVLRLAGQGLKPVFDSPRPGIAYQPDPSLVSSSLGYPSGHAYTATIIATMLVLFVHTLDPPRWARLASIAVAVLLILLALFSRIRIGAHWPTDTVGGVCFGLATVALMHIVAGSLPLRAASASPAPETRANA